MAAASSLPVLAFRLLPAGIEDVVPRSSIPTDALEAFAHVARDGIHHWADFDTRIGVATLPGALHVTVAGMDGTVLAVFAAAATEQVSAELWPRLQASSAATGITTAPTAPPRVPWLGVALADGLLERPRATSTAIIGMAKVVAWAWLLREMATADPGAATTKVTIADPFETLKDGSVVPRRVGIEADGMPTLRGTPIQVAEASAIRDRAIAVASDALMRAIARWGEALPPGAAERIRDQLPAVRARLAHAIDMHTDAGWWIGNRAVLTDPRRVGTLLHPDGPDAA